MVIAYSLTLALVIPAIFALILFASRGKLGKASGILASISLLISAFLILSNYFEIASAGVVNESYVWSDYLGLTMGFLLDSLSFPLTSMIAILGLVVSIYSIEYMKDDPKKESFFGHFLFFYIGMLGVTLATNLFEFYFFWELMLIPSYFLITIWGTPERARKIGVKYFLFTHVGALAMLIGIAFTYAHAGTFDIAAIPAALAGLSVTVTLPIFVLFVIGFAVKMAIFPFHTWLPDAHGEAPTPISVLLSGVMIETAGYALLRIAAAFYPNAYQLSSFWLMAFSVITMIYGGMMALVQTDIKRLLAYSSVSQMGYVMFGLSSATLLGVVGGMFHIVVHALGKGILFMTAGVVMHQAHHLRDLTKMGGLGRKMPKTAVIAFIAALSLAGTPPLGGFVSEFFIFSGGLTSVIAYGTTLAYVIGTFALLSSILSAAYMLRLLWKVFLGPTPEHLTDVKDPSILMWGSMAVLAILTVGFGLFPGLMVDIISHSAHALLNIP